MKHILYILKIYIFTVCQDLDVDILKLSTNENEAGL